MYCTRCGVELKESDRYCNQCGTSTPAATEVLISGEPVRRLVRDLGNKRIAGVCSGVAHYLTLDVTLVRLIWFLLIFAPVPAIIGYIVCWIVLPADYPLMKNAKWETATT